MSSCSQRKAHTMLYIIFDSIFVQNLDVNRANKLIVTSTIRRARKKHIYYKWLPRFVTGLQRTHHSQTRVHNRNIIIIVSDTTSFGFPSKFAKLHTNYMLHSESKLLEQIAFDNIYNSFDRPISSHSSMQHDVFGVLFSYKHTCSLSHL